MKIKMKNVEASEGRVGMGLVPVETLFILRNRRGSDVGGKAKVRSWTDEVGKQSQGKGGECRP